MARLEPLRAEHSDAVFRFEKENREYFACSISDRGNAYFDQFADRHRDALADQSAGDKAFFVLIDDENEVIGRFNLYDLANGSAQVGYRVAQHAAGHGVATATLRELCAIAPRLGLRVLLAVTSDENVASQKVLRKAGFKEIGVADPSELGDKQGVRYRRTLDLPPLTPE